MTDRPVFIVGSASSGTTLLAVILDAHSQIACGPELFIFDKPQIYRKYSTFRTSLPLWLKMGLVGKGQVASEEFFFNRDAYFTNDSELCELAHSSQSLREFFDHFFARYLSKRGKTIWCEKTGSNAYCMEQIFSLYPHARVVHLVRDGRDVVCSIKRRGGSPYHAISHWLYNVSAAIRWRGDERYLEVRYEDLVAQPQRTVEQICAHVGVAFEPAMLESSDNSYWSAHATGNVHSSWGARPSGAAISNSSVARHRLDLPSGELAAFWQTALTPIGRRRLRVDHHSVADLMTMLGYEPQAPSDLGPVPPYCYRDALRQYRKRLLHTLTRQRRVWLPLTHLRLSMPTRTRSTPCVASQV
jgi:hypothetical protein